MAGAESVFLWVASICAVVATALLALGVWAVFRAASEVRMFVRGLRFRGKWARIFAGRLINRF